MVADIHVDEPELPFPPWPSVGREPECSPLGVLRACPLCEGALAPEHAHFRCSTCGWRDSCCD